MQKSSEKPLVAMTKILHRQRNRSSQIQSHNSPKEKKFMTTDQAKGAEQNLMYLRFREFQFPGS